MAALPIHLRIATRQSQLALTQTRWLAERLVESTPALSYELVGLTTRGDQILDRPLAAVGGKGLFIKELEVALLDGRADIAIHSAKDVPIVLDPAFAVAFVAPREDSADAWISPRYPHPRDLPPGSCVGTSSLRRAAQLRHAFPAIEIRLLRGNVDTRLARAEAQEYDGILLAAAGLHRLGMGERITARLDTDLMLPAIAQGVLAIEYLAARADLGTLMARLTDPALSAAVTAERAMGRVLEGSCEVPLAGLAEVTDGELTLRGLIAMPDGSHVVRDRIAGDPLAAETLGIELGQRLLAQGGAAIRSLLPSA
jgi:hydroxymethylbilane synthase